MMEQKTSLSSGAMLNAYPDSIGGTAYLIQIWIAASR